MWYAWRVKHNDDDDVDDADDDDDDDDDDEEEDEDDQHTGPSGPSCTSEGAYAVGLIILDDKGSIRAPKRVGA